MVGSLMVMACVAFSNMRRRVLLHKLILLEVRNPNVEVEPWGEGRI